MEKEALSEQVFYVTANFVVVLMSMISGISIQSFIGAGLGLGDY